VTESTATSAVEDGLRNEVLAGLRSTPKTLPPKLFYDSRGAALFERITTLDEYYPTRAELSILRTYAGDMARLAGPGCVLLEFGSGAGVKIRLLLDALVDPVAYIPIDIAQDQLDRVVAELQREYPRIDVRGVHADYTRRVHLPDLPATARRVAFFPGSTIGNFHPDEAAGFLRRVRALVGDRGALILGVDRRKDPRVLEAAYDDADGVTATFNLNILLRLNRDLGAEFDVTRFRHRARFDDAASRVEMHLESLEDQTVVVAGTPVRFDKGETIWTESSYKYDETSLGALVESAGFAIDRLWTDADDRFYVAFLSAAS
jgi:dimethylhistidine N-methyltransferase